MDTRFLDRREAGRMLAGQLMSYAKRPEVLVLALPRGGVPVGYEVARALRAPLDVFVVRKLGVPGHEELAMGAISTGGIVVTNRDVVDRLGITDDVLHDVVRRERGELARRERLYRQSAEWRSPAGRTTILIDDGLATGSTMRAAVAALRVQGPERIVVAVPVSAPETCEMLSADVDEIVCAVTPEPFHAVGLWYEDFSQTTDEEVHALLRAAAYEQASQQGHLASSFTS
jgi:putative phosphoribosyl transferase